MCSKGMVIVWAHKVRAARPECWQNVSIIKYLISRETQNVRLTSIMLFLLPLLLFAVVIIIVIEYEIRIARFDWAEVHSYDNFVGSVSIC